MSAAGGAKPSLPGTDYRATRAVIDLDALHRNVEILRALLAPETELMAMVKANAYGHGGRMVASTALAAGATRLGVATVSEGIELRASGISAPILVLSPAAPAELPQAIRTGLELAVGTPELLEAVAAASGQSPVPVGIHVKVDTGMHRYGAEPELAIELATRVAGNPSLRLAGVMTHFATADEVDDSFTQEQVTVFDHVLAALEERGVVPELRHAANSAATILHPRWHYDMARVGIAMYGLRPSADFTLPAGVRPVMTLRSVIGRVHTLSRGATAGYGRSYRSEREETVGLVPIGYADGYARALSNRGWVGIGRERAPIVGRVSMDQIVVRLPPAARTKVGDEVILFGGNPDSGAPTAEEQASLLGTIAYEVVCAVAARVPRYFLRHGEVIGIESLFGLDRTPATIMDVGLK